VGRETWAGCLFSSSSYWLAYPSLSGPITDISKALQVPGSQTRYREMTSDRGHLPRRYFVDGSGRRVLIGLTIEETSEFETLDNHCETSGFVNYN
jgi:hypothetical protein